MSIFQAFFQNLAQNQTAEPANFVEVNKFDSKENFKNEFKKKVLEIVKRIPQGSFLSYLQVAKKAKKPKNFRQVGNILAQNRDPKVPCHRVIKNNNEIGGYFGSKKNSLKKAAILLKEGAIGVIPTDTIYGICTSAFKKNSIEKIYQLKKRDPKKPMIILISSIDDLKKFNIKAFPFKKILKKIWPGKISAILPCKDKRFFYLHRGRETLAFRLPKEKEILKILSFSGPLVAPSANIEGESPAVTISEAKKYFGKKVFYLNKGKIFKKPSTLIDLTKKPFLILRKGADFGKIKSILKNFDFG